jgi:tetratricopeptide (TPR) repeat protein
MPKADIAKVAHSNFTDHWIRVVDDADEPETGTVHSPPGLLPLFARDRNDPVYEGMAYVVYGTQQQDRAYLEQGVERLSSGLKEDSDFGRAHFLLGLALTQLGRSEDAIPPLERAVTLDPDTPERLNALAQAYEADSRDPVRIERLYRRALAIQPVRSDIRVNLGRFLESRGRLEEAAQAYQEAIAHEPRLMSAHYNYGTVLLRLGRPDEAESRLREAIDLDPLDPEAWDNLGILYAQSGRAADALNAFRKAVEVAPDSPVALGNLGTHYLQTNRLDEAIPLLARATQLAPDYLDARVNLALAYFRNDEFERARQQAEKALEIAPDNALARQIIDAI